MAESDVERAVRAVCESVPDHMRPFAREMAEQAAFMAGKLAEQRAGLADQPLVVEYDNGGGQSGVRRNPAFAEYNALFRSYASAVRSLRELCAEGGEDGRDAGGLEDMRRASPLFRAV